ncbi:MAG: Lrp/AsnC ligand binding domain-containing protein [Nitrosopumilaceae archaeon]
MGKIVSSFILITCDVGKEDAVQSELEKLNDVKEVSRVHGAYDLIAKVEDKSVEKVKEILAQKIRKMTEVRSAMNLPLKFCN